jgi:cytidine deaminase
VTLVDWDKLRAAAIDAMSHAYAPYSKFHVGAAAFVDDGRIVVGCNVENASYGLGLCAECGMVSALHTSGGGRLVAVSCVDGVGGPLMPCGRCRQLLWEFGGPDCLIDADGGAVRMSDLLPHAFDASELDRPPVEVLPAGLRQWHGRGTVFVHPDTVSGTPVWTAYWERSTGLSESGAAGEAGPDAAGPDEERGILEEGPTWPEVAQAVAWGRARTPRVVVVDAEGGLSWAGEGEAPMKLRQSS